MHTTGSHRRTLALAASAASVLLIVAAVPSTALAHGRPGTWPPRPPRPCHGLSGAPFALCTAYCEVQNCDVHPRPSCGVLRHVFHRLTGSAALPCDPMCGDGRINRAGEECDPPGAACADGRICSDECTCPEPVCGDGILDPGEACEPGVIECDGGRECNNGCGCPEPTCGDGILDPGEACEPGAVPCDGEEVCEDDCVCRAPTCGDGIVEAGEECDPPGSAGGCVGGPCTGTCSCPDTRVCCVVQLDTAPFCQNNVLRDLCILNGGVAGAPGTICNSSSTACIPPQPTVCCQCIFVDGSQSCALRPTAADCPAGCQAFPNVACTAAGECDTTSVPVGP